MKKILLALLTIAIMSSGPLLASSGGVHLASADIDVDDVESVQRGAKVFSEYCLSCHSAKFVRFNRIGHDLGMTEKEVMSGLNNLGVNYGSPMEIAMSKDYAEMAFGAAPPDMSLLARSRGVDWLYTYLTSFYADPARTTGYNNAVFKDVGMPNIFWKQQGVQKPVYEKHGEDEVMVGVEQVEKGTMNPDEFNSMIRDLVAFLSYIGEPNQSYRKTLGIYVLLFLGLLFAVSYAMKKEFWKDVH
jgi:ubiquinol-cytochrome c reductase cytochrome c1 subunit